MVMFHLIMKVKVNQHVNFLKRRGLLIREEKTNQVINDFEWLDNIEPMTLTKGYYFIDIRKLYDSNKITIFGLIKKLKEIGVRLSLKYEREYLRSCETMYIKHGEMIPNSGTMSSGDPTFNGRYKEITPDEFMEIYNFHKK